MGFLVVFQHGVYFINFVYLIEQINARARFRLVCVDSVEAVLFVR